MNMSLIKRDLKLAARSGGAWLLGLAFFMVFLTLTAIALGGDANVMRPLAPALIWLAVILSAMLSFSSVFMSDYADGTLEQLKLSKISMLSLCASKAAAYFIMAIAPLIIAAPIAALAFDLPSQVVWGICFSLFFAAPALSVYGIFASAVMAGRGASGFLVILITAPFLIPLLIFGVAAVDSYVQTGLSAPEFRALAGLSLIGSAIGLPAAAAALNANLE